MVGVVSSSLIAPTKQIRSLLGGLERSTERLAFFCGQNLRWICKTRVVGDLYTLDARYCLNLNLSIAGYKWSARSSMSEVAGDHVR